MDFVRTLLDSLKLTFLIVPPRPARRIGPRSFWLAALLVTLLLAIESFAETLAPRVFQLTALQGAAFICLLALLLAYTTAATLRRPALLWPLATLILLIQVWIDLLVQTPAELWLLPKLGLSAYRQQLATLVIWVVLTLVATRRLFDYLEPYRSAAVRTGAAAAVAAMILVPLLFIGTGSFFYTGWDPGSDADFTRKVEPSFDPERLMMRQDELVDSAVAALAPEQPGKVDLYVVGFGGDGGEDVFRNEVEYVDRLFAERFGARGRSLVLVNHDDTVDEYPLATRANLARALRGVGRVADPREDLVLLFFTSHGSEDHELAVSLEPLPLAQLKPVDIATAIDEAALGWRIVIVSACYAGGFIPALADEHALVMTSARKDRTSFGCGTDSQITWFGRAYFAEGLNRTGSMLEAFSLADDRISEWEERDGHPHSFPQISTSPAIEQKLAAWMQQIRLGPKVEFAGLGRQP